MTKRFTDEITFLDRSETDPKILKEYLKKLNIILDEKNRQLFFEAGSYKPEMLQYQINKILSECVRVMCQLYPAQMGVYKG